MTSRSANPQRAMQFKRRVQAWAARLRVEPKQLRVQKMSRKWASCSTGGRVTFSVGVLYESTVFQDYVIVHELLHLRGLRNHGKLFKSLIKAYLGQTEQGTRGQSASLRDLL